MSTLIPTPPRPSCSSSSRSARVVTAMLATVLVPVLDRPHAYQPLVDSLAASGADAEILFLCNTGRVADYDALAQTRARWTDVPWSAGRGDYARKINYGCGIAETDWILTGADDLRFHAGWLEHALSEHERTGARVIGTNDLCNPLVIRGAHSTHTLVHRTYVEEGGTFERTPGVLLHEGYDHQCIDVELVTVAKTRREYAHSKASMIEHLHPLCGKGERDATYEKALAQGKADIRLYRQRLGDARRARPKARL